jgi:hypothetical protein
MPIGTPGVPIMQPQVRARLDPTDLDLVSGSQWQSDWWPLSNQEFCGDWTVSDPSGAEPASFQIWLQAEWYSDGKLQRQPERSVFAQEIVITKSGAITGAWDFVRDSEKEWIKGEIGAGSTLLVLFVWHRIHPLPDKAIKATSDDEDKPGAKGDPEGGKKPEGEKTASDRPPTPPDTEPQK